MALALLACAVSFGCASETGDGGGTEIVEAAPLSVGEEQRDKLCALPRSDIVLDVFCRDEPPDVDGVLALLVAVAFMLVVFGQIPINDVLVGRLSKSEWRSRAIAARYIITFSVTATSIPGIAWIHANGGFDVLFMLLSGLAMLIFLAVVMLPGDNPVVDGRTAQAA